MHLLQLQWGCYGNKIAEENKQTDKNSVATQATHAFNNVSSQCVALDDDNNNNRYNNNDNISIPIIGVQTIRLLRAAVPESLSEEAVTMATGGIEIIT